ncbi:hypothetical protein BV25DRAFT_1556995 [Artomyces pyxidatus]|uniref:Uncharacterized protein n=1 Tax=Artomyces pyxidatus TaxID=48021 RepID=A0ACB8SJC3_9AGAM|nr:hypothetical protein BV25DRAFT_1556995 [Artomyces pyxidatus]
MHSSRKLCILHPSCLRAFHTSASTRRSPSASTPGRACLHTYASTADQIFSQLLFDKERTTVARLTCQDLACGRTKEQGRIRSPCIYL